MVIGFLIVIGGLIFLALFLRRLHKELQGISGWSNNLYFGMLLTEDEIEEMTSQYASRYITRFKKVAEQAYRDGVKDTLKAINQKDS